MPAINYWKAHRDRRAARLLLYWMDKERDIPALIRQCIEDDETANFYYENLGE